MPLPGREQVHESRAERLLLRETEDREGRRVAIDDPGPVRDLKDPLAEARKNELVVDELREQLA